MQTPSFRRSIWERDGGLCGFCGEAVSLAEMELDHIKPRAVGGTSEEANLRPAHRICNRQHGWAEVLRFRREQPDECVTVPPVHDRRLIHLAMPPDLVSAVEEFRFANRIPSKAAAWRWLLGAALDAGMKPAPEELEEMERG